MKKIPMWAIVAFGGAVAYLIWQNSSTLRQDAWKLGRTISERSGGAIPVPPRTWLPSVDPDPGFSVGFGPGNLPDWLQLDTSGGMVQAGGGRIFPAVPYSPSPRNAQTAGYVSEPFGVGFN